jgi:hypothetical protein
MMIRLALSLYAAVLRTTVTALSAGLGAAILYTLVVAASPLLAVGSGRRAEEPARRRPVTRDGA